MPDWWDDFSNNLATDLAPLISLFGESPTKQYLSECLSPEDILIFAIAPLGIVTAVVSAIRVCGSSSLRAFIGRAQEGAGNAEAELCSSTSREVCELFNNGGIARVFGRPKLLEVVYDQKVKPEDFYPKEKDKGEKDQRRPTSGLYTFQEYFESVGKSEWKEKLKKSSKPDEENKKLQKFAHNPNLSLNVGIKTRNPSWFIAAAVLGISLQSAVLVWAALARYSFRHVKGNPQDAYAVPVMVVGTILLGFGMGWCAYLIEDSTRERVFERQTEGKQTSQMFWVQPGVQYVGDQAFDSFAYTEFDSRTKAGPLNRTRLKRYTTSWRVPWLTENTKQQPEDAKRRPVKRVWAAVGATVTGFVLQFVGLRACHSTVAVAQLGVTLVMSTVRAMLRSRRLNSEDNFMGDPDIHQGHELDGLALCIGSDSLGDCKSRLKRRKWMVLSGEHHPQETDNSPKEGESTSTSTSTPNGKGSTSTTLPPRLWPNEKNIMVAGFNFKSSIPPYEWLAKAQSERQLADYSKKEFAEDDPDYLPNYVAQPFLFRSRLARMTENWDDKKGDNDLIAVRNAARSLCEAIQATANILTTYSTLAKGCDEISQLSWAIRSKLFLDSHTAKSSHEVKSVFLSLKRATNHDPWLADVSELEAVLGLWTWSLSSTRTERRSEEGPPRKSTMCRIFSDVQESEESAAKLELDLWLGTGASIAARNMPSNKGLESEVFGWQNITGKGKTTRCLVLQTSQSLPKMCAQEIFSLFLLAMLLSIVDDLNGQTEVRPSFKSFHMTHTTISDIQKAFTENGLGSKEDSFVCIIPAIRLSQKLPSVPSALRQAREVANGHIRDKQWTKAQELLDWALKYATNQKPADQGELDSYQNHRRLLTLTLCECYRMSLADSTGSETDWGTKGLLKLLENWTASYIKDIPLLFYDSRPHAATSSTEEDTIVSTIKCYSHVALRIAEDRGVDSELAKKLEAELTKTDKAKPDFDCQQDLCQAIEDGSLAKTLYRLGNNSTHRQKDLLAKSLWSAAARGWFIVVNALLELGSSLDKKDPNDRTALSHAVTSRDINTFEYLLEKGSYPNFMDAKRRSPLSYAAEYGLVAIVETLLKDSRVDSDSRDNDGRTPLSFAAENGHQGIVKLLLESDKVNAADSKDKFDRTPLSFAANKGHEGIVKLLLESNKVNDVDSKDNNGRTPLSLAARKRHEGIVKLLLESDKVNAADSEDEYGWTPLSFAAAMGHEGIVKLLLESNKVNADDSKGKDGRTPLSFAVENEHQGIVKLLLESNKVNDVDSKDNNGRTPLSLAAERGYEEIVKLLLESDKVNADDSKGKDGRTPLSFAVEKEYQGIVKLLLESNKVNDVDSKDNNGRTPLSLAAKRGYEEIVKLLLESDKVNDADSKDYSGRTPLSLATQKRHEGIVKLLLESDKVNAADSEDEYGWTPLSFAAAMGHEGIVKLLLESDKVNADSKDKFGRTPLFFAAQAGYEGIVKLLLETGKADANSKDKNGWTPVSFAAQNRHEGIVKLLQAFITTSTPPRPSP